MNKQLTAGLGNIQVVLKELLNGEKGLVIQAFDGAFLKDLPQVLLAQGGGQLINDARDTQVIIADDKPLGIEYLAHFQRGLRLTEGPGQILDAGNDTADADLRLGVEFTAQGIHDGTGQLFQVLAFDARLDFLHQYDIGLIDIKDKVLLLIGEEVLHHIKGGNAAVGLHPHQQHRAAGIGGKVQLPRLGKDIAGQDVIQNDILDKIAAVVFFIVVLLDAGKGDTEHAAHFSRQVIAAGNKHGILRLHLGAKGLVGNAVPDEQLVIFAQIRRQKIVRLADLGQVAAGNDGGALINDADHAVHSIPHLINQALEQTVRHKTTPLLSQKIAVTHSL